MKKNIIACLKKNGPSPFGHIADSLSSDYPQLRETGASRDELQDALWELIHQQVVGRVPAMHSSTGHVIFFLTKKFGPDSGGGQAPIST
jgi:hypothetical protein